MNSAKYGLRSVGSWQCQAECCYEQKPLSQATTINQPLFPSTVRTLPCCYIFVRKKCGSKRDRMMGLWYLHLPASQAPEAQ